MSGSAAVRSGRWNTTRWKNSPPVGVVGVLVERDDVARVAGDQRGHGGDDPGLVGAVDDQAGVVAQRLVVQRHRRRSSGLGGDELARPLGRREQPAERVEVQLRRSPVAVGSGRRAAPRGRSTKRVGAGGAHQVGQREAVLLHDHRVRADAEAAGEAEQPLDAGRPGRADADRACRCRGRAPALIQAMTGSVSKANCVRMSASSPCSCERRRLVVQVPPEHVVGDVGVALGIAGDRAPRARRTSAAARCGSRRTSPRTGPRARPGRRRPTKTLLGRADLLQAAEELLELGLRLSAAAPRCAARGRSRARSTAFAAATRISRSSLPRNVTLTFVPAGIVSLRLVQAGRHPCRSSRASSR